MSTSFGIGRYVGRFAPSPTGPLHAGSLVTALASWLDARAHHGRWLVRIEDVDKPRCIKGMDEIILNQLATFGLTSDAPVMYQSRRTARYETALTKLQSQDLVYHCYCSRKEIGTGIYSGTCRQTSWDKTSQASWPASQYSCRLRVDGIFKNTLVHWKDRRLGMQSQNVANDVGDFVIKRADGLFAYQLAVVVDDLDQGITHIVRGEDLADNTARQLLLKDALQAKLDKDFSNTIGGDFQYLHVPLVLAEDGQKLSKQNGAVALDVSDPLRELNLAATSLGLHQQQGVLGEALMAWTLEWRTIWI